MATKAKEKEEDAKARDLDLSPLLAKRLAADQIYEIVWLFSNLHAFQGRNNHTRLLESVSLDQTADTTYTQGTPEDSKSPIDRKRGTKTSKKNKIPWYCFERFPGDRVPPDDGIHGGQRILIEVGGQYGLLSKLVRDVITAMRKARYSMAPSVLMSFAPVSHLPQTRALNSRYLLVAAATTCSSSLDVLEDRYGKNEVKQHLAEAQQLNKDLLEGKVPKDVPRPEKRLSSRAETVLVPVFHERLAEPIEIVTRLTINSECPLSSVEIAGILHAMRAAPVGPAKRGHAEIVSCKRLMPNGASGAPGTK